MAGIDAAERELRQACALLDSALRSGNPKRAEGLLNDFPALAADEDQVVELVLNEYAIRESLGEVIERGEYFARFPQLRERLERLFEVDRLLRDSVVEPLESVHDSTLVDSRRHSPHSVAKRRQIGSYEVVSTIGSGGMGVVYQARQLGLNRLAAVKVLRGEADVDDATRTRFIREAELAAQLQHPNIVQVYEIGETDGQPFLAMELVAGCNLHQRLDGRPLALDAAVELMLGLAKAMAYAHERGVVHRDLKPANVLLPDANRGGEAAPTAVASDYARAKIADFGLAIRVDEKRALTAHGQVLGTVTYMAPEQASGQARQPSATMDVYSLGAILYETLTGRPPFLAEGFRETIRKLLEEDPLPPRQLRPTCPRDLETICLKCLAKEPAKRYPNAGELADDLDRFRNSRPVLARPVGRMEQMAKWVQRRPWAAAFVGLAIVATISLAGTIISYTSRLDRAAREAKEGWSNADAAAVKLALARDAEAEQSRRTRKALDMVTDHIVEDWFGRNPGLQARHFEFLRKARDEYLALERAGADDDQLPIGLANANRRIGGLQMLLGQFAEAEKTLKVAIAHFNRIREGDSANVDAHVGWLWSTSMQCSLLQQTARHQEASTVAEAALNNLESLRSRFGKEMWWRTGMAQLSIYPSISLLDRTEYAAADRSVALCQENWEKLRKDNSNDPQARQGLLWTLQVRVVAAYNEGRLADSEKHSREIVRLGSEFLRNDPGNFDLHFRIAVANANIGGIEAERKQRGPGVGVDRLEDAIRSMEHHLRAFPNRPMNRLDYGLALSSMALIRLQSRQPKVAIAAGEQAVRELRKVVETAPNCVKAEIGLGGAQCNLGNAHRMDGNQAVAVQCYNNALVTLAAVAKKLPANKTPRQFIGNTHMGRGKSLEAMKQFKEAADDYAEALKYPIPNRLRTYIESERDKIVKQLQ